MNPLLLLSVVVPGVWLLFRSGKKEDVSPSGTLVRPGTAIPSATVSIQIGTYSDGSPRFFLVPPQVAAGLQAAMNSGDSAKMLDYSKAIEKSYPASAQALWDLALGTKRAPPTPVYANY